MRRLIAAAALALASPPAAGDEPGPGARLFHAGAGAEALLADGRVRVSAASFACAGCHGADGRGRREGGTDFPPLVWSALTDPERAGGPYTAAALRLTLETGIAPDGRMLGAAMPRFDVAPGVVEDLAVYLAALEANERAGVTAGEIRLAPPAAAQAAAGFRLALAVENASGGVWGRRLVAASSGDTLLTAAEAEAALAPALDRALAAAVAQVLAVSGVPAVSLDEEEPLRDALAAAGVRLADDAAAGLARATGGAVLTLPDGRCLRIGVAPDLPELASVGEPGDEAALGYMLGAEAANAALSCGRNASRTCLLERLAGASLASWVKTTTLTTAAAHPHP